MVTIYNKQRRIPVNIGDIKSLLQKILDILDYSDFDIGLLITTDKTIRKYNRTYRHKDKPTDILSFSYHPTLRAGKRILVKSPEDKNVGDLIISLEYIKKRAEELKIPLEQHLKTLLVHGVCHLLGYDHETDNQYRSMKTKETYILTELDKRS